MCIGTPEVGGLTVMQALEIVRGLRGINLVATDLVEVHIVYLLNHCIIIDIIIGQSDARSFRSYFIDWSKLAV